MQLLVSVADAAEAAVAVAGGADVIDAKNPASGPLGAVELTVLRQIAAAAGVRLISAALGDAANESAVESAAFQASAAGARLVKIGFAGVGTTARAAILLSAAQRGALAGSLGRCSVAAVAYAEAIHWSEPKSDPWSDPKSDPRSDPRSDPWSDPALGLHPDDLLQVAAAAGA